ncbi:Phospholipase D1 [Coniosporium tulheliwenetii]|uniref:Phospholipase D1 n=1 Tax=Coniosporium tulheliwenetii TaxID=3383036 RepID=A0ACC2Z858_9PEZI|nr:Phospholipase D1 [Cladosporium sp. JES 115]
MAEYTDSVSPFTRSPHESPRSASPNNTKVDSLATRDAHVRVQSPLRTEQRANGSISSSTVPNGEPVKSSYAASGTGGFPFNAPPGAVGETPTNELMAPSGSGAATPRDAVSDLPPNGPISRKATSEFGVPTPRRSVQFARSSTQENAPSSQSHPHSRQQSWDPEDGEPPIMGRHGSSLFSKLKALATPTSLHSHGRSASGWTAGDAAADESTNQTPTGPRSPGSERLEPRYDYSSEADADADADAEESPAEGASGRPPRRRRKGRRLPDGGAQTAPTTPKALPSFLQDSPGNTPTSAMGQRPTFMSRHSTLENLPEHHRHGFSEDEGRDRLESGWRRGFSHRGLTHSAHRHHDSEGTPDNRRPSNFRRITGFGGHHGDEASPSTWRRNIGERATSVSAQKWRSMKNALRLLGRQRKEDKVDHAKSAELLAELLAGAPAALFLASNFQRDEHGRKRVPVLLEQLKVRITDSTRTDPKGKEKQPLFRIELEYGSGITRMKWVINRSARDFTNLHLKYKVQSSQEKYLKFNTDDPARTRLPRFPKSVARDYVPGVLGSFGDDDDEEEDEANVDPADGDDTERPGKGKRRRSSFGFSRRKSSTTGPSATGANGGLTGRAGSIVGTGASSNRKETVQERQRKKLELYLTQLITSLILRPDANRLCKFLEISALGVRLAAENSYHGKEGSLMISTGKGIDFRRAWRPELIKARHQPKWFLVRDNYITCVDSPEEMNIYDVFLVDQDFTIEAEKRLRDMRDQSGRDIAKKAKTSAAHPKHHRLTITNSERTVKLLAKNERILHQFEESITIMQNMTSWSKPHRFDSFAPVRQNVFARWLVDGRDYMWNVSRAIEMAQDVIYIHDWWLSPELYMRRPPAISQKWRLDRLLQRKAQEGVKIFIIIYRNINTAIPIDSEYTKFSLLDLHPNVFVQRSPNQLRQNTFFWAHHEKICVVDHTIAFCGGIDLCFGRWDTPEHSLTDDKLTGFELNDVPKDSEHCQNWPGKDYSNPRVQDFYALDKPYEEMYDRTKVPRMPWHDIAMQIVAQAIASNAALASAPDFLEGELKTLGLDGTCEVQILRSAASWSIGTPNRVECSIHNAYIKMIESSDHFVYIENQFFISSCEVEGVKIENKIGDALVERIKRAHEDQEDWRAVVIIPLMPGFQNTVDQQDGSSVRLIMTCQYRSICRGETSIFGRLRAVGIEPEDYIQFYALRSWGKIGPNKALVTEQLYIHAKCMIVDDRVAIIGSANINERSMLGGRDSEVAAVVRDRAMVPSVMAGEAYKVGVFPHTLRMRLMREHLGLDVDELEAESLSGRRDRRTPDAAYDSDNSISVPDHITEQKLADAKHKWQDELLAKNERMHSFNHDVDWEEENNPNLMNNKRLTADARVTKNPAHQADVAGLGVDRMVDHIGVDDLGRDSTILPSGREVLVSDVAAEGKGTIVSPSKGKQKGQARAKSAATKASAASSDPSVTGNTGLPPARIPRMDTQALGLTLLSQLPALPVLDDTDIGGPPLHRTFSSASSNIIHPFLTDMKRPVVTPDCMRDPLNDAFFIDTWQAIAENNTKIFRQVFRCMPDNEVKTWKEYKEYAAFAERFSRAQGQGKSMERREQEAHGKTGPPGTGTLKVVGHVGEKAGQLGDGVQALFEKTASRDSEKQDKHMGTVAQWADEQEKSSQEGTAHRPSDTSNRPWDEKAALKAEETTPPTTAQLTTVVTAPASSPMPPFIPEGAATVPTDDLPAHTAAGEKLDVRRPRTVTYSSDIPPPGAQTSAPDIASTTFKNTNKGKGNTKRRRRATTKSSTRQFHANDDNILLDRHDAETLLGLVQGNLVVWPYDWLEKEERGGGWMYAVDQLAPLEIYD